MESPDLRCGDVYKAQPGATYKIIGIGHIAAPRYTPVVIYQRLETLRLFVMEIELFLKYEGGQPLFVKQPRSTNTVEDKPVAGNNLHIIRKRMPGGNYDPVVKETAITIIGDYLRNGERPPFCQISKMVVAKLGENAWINPGTMSQWEHEAAKRIKKQQNG